MTENQIEDDKVSREELQRIVLLIRKFRLPLHDEKQTQEAMLKAFEVSGLNVQREFRFLNGDKIDFLLDNGIGIEVKVKGQRMAMFRQLERYTTSEHISGIILATAVKMDLPAEINNKPAIVASLTHGWI